jgi:hypothetical protein
MHMSTPANKEQHILNEIRRTAKINGGAPLRKRQFKAETGIKESDWSGRFWARWGDAVREAGFIPNTLQPKIDEGALLSRLGTLVRELHRFPTIAEMRTRKRQDDAFPNHKVIERLGSKHELVARLAAFCGRTEEWADVTALCREIQATAGNRLHLSRLNEGRAREAFQVW